MAGNIIHELVYGKAHWIIQRWYDSHKNPFPILLPFKMHLLLIVVLFVVLYPSTNLINLCTQYFILLPPTFNKHQLDTSINNSRWITYITVKKKTKKKLEVQEWDLSCSDSGSPTFASALLWFRVTSLVLLRFQTNMKGWNSYCPCLCQKGVFARFRVTSRLVKVPVKHELVWNSYCTCLCQKGVELWLYSCMYC